MCEEDLLRMIGASFPHAPSVPLGVGDDAAALLPRAGQYLLATTDSLVEGIHFDLAFFSYSQLGQRAVAVNVSDIAAMGGTPTALLVSLGLTARQGRREIAALYRGMEKEAGQIGQIALVGGNLSSSPTFWLSITLLGEVTPKKVVKRTGARVGDRLYVTGTLGDAAAGLAILKSGRDRDRRYRPLIAQYRTPHARQREGASLAAEGLASAMIDLSDGLSTDAGHLAERSGVGIEIDAAQIPISPALRRYARQTGGDPLGFALNGGDDYELFFAVPPRKEARLLDLIQRGILDATPIGMVTPKSRGPRIRIDGQLRPLVAAGYDHRALPRYY